MERQAGLGRSLGDVLDSLAPVGPAHAPPRHVLFGIGPDEPSTTKSTTNGAEKKRAEKTKKKNPKAKKKSKQKKSKKKSKK